jgi:2-methylisocitrate lyase-like PEP mutase family enzyme
MNTPVPSTTDRKRSLFRSLHSGGCFLLPNPWDVGSARLLQSLGFAALATTSTGFAWAMGVPDYVVPRDVVLGHLSTLCRAVDLPVNADFESGFASAPADVAANVKLAIDAGVAGISIEDRIFGDVNKLYETPHAAERVRAAKSAINESGADVILVGRTEGLLLGATVTAATDKLVALAEAGADCLYAPGVGMPGLGSKQDIAAMVKAVAPKVLNVLVTGPGVTYAELSELGVRRVSVGGALSQVCWAALLKASQLLKVGQFEALSGGMTGAQLNELFKV